jgi:hypothetical protein
VGRSSIRSYGLLRPPESRVGRVDTLFELLHRLELDTPERIQPFISTLDPDTERRSVADQIVDQVVVTDPSRYELYREIKQRFDHDGRDWPAGTRATSNGDQNALEAFLRSWIAYERHLREASSVQGLEEPAFLPSRRILERFAGLDAESKREIDRIRRLRNSVVHGIEAPEPAMLREATETLQRILARLDSQSNGEKQE